MARCIGTTATDTPCQAEARRDSDYCFFHDPESKQARRQAQSRGGSKKPTLRPLSPPPSDFSLAGPKDILKFVEYTANRIIHGELDPKTAYALGYLADCALRAYNGGPLAERLDRIEQLLKAECDIPVGRSEYMGVEFRDTPDQADEDEDHGPQDELSEPLAEETAPEAEQVRALHTKRRAA